MKNIFQKKIKRTIAVHEEPSMQDYIKSCIDKALETDETYENIKYKGIPYNFGTITDKKDIQYKLDYVEEGMSICIIDDNQHEIAWIHMHFRYKDNMIAAKKRPYKAHINKLGVVKDYRFKGYATYLICVSLLIANMLEVEEITVHNTCEYQELYSLFEYNSSKIREVK